MQMLDCHVHDNYGRSLGDSLPIMAFRDETVCSMTGDEGHRGVGIPMSHRNPCISRSRRPRCHSWNNPKGYARFYQIQCFLAPSAEDKGITAFEPQHPFLVSCPLNDAVGNVRLFGRWLPSAFACVFQFAGGSGEPQDFFIDQCIVDHHISLLKPIQSMKGQQTRISRSCAGEPDPARFEYRKLKSFNQHILQTF